MHFALPAFLALSLLGSLASYSMPSSGVAGPGMACACGPNCTCGPGCACAAVPQASFMPAVQSSYSGSYSQPSYQLAQCPGGVCPAPAYGYAAPAYPAQTYAAPAISYNYAQTYNAAPAYGAGYGGAYYGAPVYAAPVAAPYYGGGYGVAPAYGGYYGGYGVGGGFYPNVNIGFGGFGRGFGRGFGGGFRHR